MKVKKFVISRNGENELTVGEKALKSYQVKGFTVDKEIEVDAKERRPSNQHSGRILRGERVVMGSTLADTPERASAKTSAATEDATIASTPKASTTTAKKSSGSKTTAKK